MEPHCNFLLVEGFRVLGFKILGFRVLQPTLPEVDSMVSLGTGHEPASICPLERLYHSSTHIFHPHGLCSMLLQLLASKSSQF